MYQRSQYIKALVYGQDISDFATKNCLQPIKLHNAFDPLTGTHRELTVPCGTCIRCREQLQREWVTRMSVESNSWKYHYFVTLTFGSYNLNVFKEHPFKKDWLSMRPQLDSYNSSHRPAWTPSLLQNSIFTKFVKRLRANTSAELCFMYCGEYGETWGRPHAHFIIFSNKYLDDSDFFDAWSYKVYYTKRKWKDKTFYYCKKWTKKGVAPHLFRIGQVKTYNLTFNGTMSYKRKFDPKQREQNALHVFSYVAKYVHKQQTYCPYVLLRMKKAFLSEKVTPNFYFKFDDEAQQNKTIRNIELRTHGILKNKLTTLRTITKNSFKYEKVSFANYCKIYSPYFLSSRRPAIGKKYALANLEQFANGNFALEKRFGRQMEFPKYFYQILFNSQYPIRLQVSNGRNISYCKGSLPYISKYYQHLRDFGPELTSLLSSSEITFDKSLAKVFLSAGFKATEKSSNIMDLHFVNPSIGNIYCRFNSADSNYHLYLFDRSRKCYNQFSVLPLEDFCDAVLAYISNQLKQTSYRQRLYEEREQFFKLLSLHPHSLDKINSFISLRKEDNLKYKSTHLNSDKL